jgi:hypothetical protein
MPDSNDIVYDTYGLDLVGIFHRIAASVHAFFSGGDALGGGGLAGAFDTLGYWWDVYSVIAIALSLLFFVGFIYARIRVGQLDEEENELIRAEEAAWEHAAGSGGRTNSRWSDIQSHLASEDPNDWRLAIIEADIVLDETLTNAGYVGVSIGEKLKTANPASFTTIRDAWDAHTIRNKIAHEGSDFVLTRRVAQEAILKYERVFREFGVL